MDIFILFHFSNSQLLMNRNHIRFEHVDNQGYLFDGITGYVYLLNETGSIIAKNILNSSKENAIIQLLNEYDVDINEAKQDVNEFIKKMEEMLCQHE